MLNIKLFLGNNFCSGKKLLKEGLLKWRNMLKINPKVGNVKMVVTENSVTILYFALFQASAQYKLNFWFSGLLCSFEKQVVPSFMHMVPAGVTETLELN